MQQWDTCNNKIITRNILFFSRENTPSSFTKMAIDRTAKLKVDYGVTNKCSGRVESMRAPVVFCSPAADHVVAPFN